MNADKKIVPVVGNEAVVITSWDRKIFVKIKTVTKTGQVVVTWNEGQSQMRFNERGWETGSHSTWRRAHLVLDVESMRVQINKERRMMHAAAAINAVRVENIKHTYCKDAMKAAITDLEALLATAKAAVEAL